MAHIKKPLGNTEPKKPLRTVDQNNLQSKSVEEFNLQDKPLPLSDSQKLTEIVTEIVVNPENTKNKPAPQDQQKPATKDQQKQPAQPDQQKLELYHSVSSALNTAINTIGTEIAKLRVRSVNTQYSLDEKELKALNDFFKTLIAYEAHQAALAKQEALTGKLSDLSDEDLLDMVNKTLKEKK